MAYIERDGVRVYFEDHGTGPGVLLSHGFSASSTMWREQIAALQDRYRVMTWDMRGHGQSDYPDDPAAYSEAHSVADMAAILDACGLQRAVIGGLSLGGCASLAFHLYHPDRTAGLMLFDTGPGFKKDAARDAWNETAHGRAASFEAEGLDALGDAPALRIAGHRDATGLAHAARGMLAQFDDKMIQSLPSITVPTLVLVGSEDVKFHAATDYMAGKIAAAQKVVIDGAGHEANMDQPAAFNQAMRGFLDGLAL
ncbi:MAG: alpha/beta fold hydrolase [Alphaproteobacteria bacterium]|nr:alpha/beta fold hydrolase [Alphaproteobacteria bacterium]